MMTTGTIEEKIFQRQINKEGLQSVVDGGQDDAAQAEENLMSRDQLKDLFTYDPDTLSTTFEHMVLDKIPDDVDTDLTKRGPVDQEQTGQPKEDDLGNWGLHSCAETVPDECMQLCGTKDVSFVFSCKVTGKEIPPDPPILGKGAGPEPDAPVTATVIPSKVLSERNVNVPNISAEEKRPQKRPPRPARGSGNSTLDVQAEDESDGMDDSESEGDAAFVVDSESEASESELSIED